MAIPIATLDYQRVLGALGAAVGIANGYRGEFT